ncbi:hypothetical protein [Sphingobium lactosutens]|uniref:hypothetical protein n=1 Tax=Sphingobium lactosutens TaxID=522773 RepID=UPI0015BC672C|nr:hypothetical protein [Sphingobium lactosutens]
MKPYLALPAMLLTVSCTSSEQRRHLEIMDAIEHAVQIPSGAGPMSQFARTYKYASPTRVVAFYFIPDETTDELFCEGAKEGGPKNGQVLLGCPPPDGMKAGERRWLNNDVFLPDINDGGCNYIDIEYDLKSKLFIRAECHGEA